MIRTIRHEGLAALFHHDQTKSVQQAQVSQRIEGIQVTSFVRSETESLPMGM